MNKPTIPEITLELLEWIDGLFPDTVPDGDDPIALFRAQGQQQVIRKLHAEHRNQTQPTYE